MRAGLHDSAGEFDDIVEDQSGSPVLRASVLAQLTQMNLADPGMSLEQIEASLDLAEWFESQVLMIHSLSSNPLAFARPI